MSTLDQGMKAMKYQEELLEISRTYLNALKTKEIRLHSVVRLNEPNSAIGVVEQIILERGKVFLNVSYAETERKILARIEEFSLV